MLTRNTKSGADSLLRSLSHGACRATQYTCSLSGVCRPTDQYREVVGVHAHAFRSTRLSGQVSSRLHKLFSLY